MFVLTVRNDSKKKTSDASFMLSSYLESQGIDNVIVDSSKLYSSNLDSIFDEIGGSNIDMAVVLGGDGTILKTAGLLQGKDAPILGINFGHLGFLANSSESGVIPLVAKAFAGELIVDRRANLLIDVVCDDDVEAEGFLQGSAFGDNVKGVNREGISGKRSFFALNEIAITRGAMGKVLDYSFDISDVDIATASGDGLIIASATGSTAYSLAAGGPLVNPNFTGLVVQPLAPHSLTARAVLTDRSDVVHMELKNDKSRRAATLFADGDMLLFDKAVTDVYVRIGDVPTTLLYEESEHFYKYSAKTFF